MLKIPQKVVLATHNPGKVAELQDTLASLGWEVISTASLGLEAPEETADSFAGNAMLKAAYASNMADMWALADDSGLEVEALGGAPGVQTAYYGGYERLLDATKDIPSEQRHARFVCVLALHRPDYPVKLFQGVCHGHIALAANGSGGFGYDPVFIPEGEQRTFASMTRAEKYAFSHRGKAIKALMAWIEDGARD